MSLVSRREFLKYGAAVSAGMSLLPLVTPLARATSDITTGSFESTARGGIETGWKIARPPGVDTPLRPVIALHGRDESADSLIWWGFEHMLADVVSNGAPPFAVAAVDGGNSYWHPRAAEDTAAMVITEFIPLLSDQGLDTSRVAFLGWSAGGYGALLIGSMLGPPRTAAIAAVSPALWTTYDAATPDAFDDEQNWAANSVFDRPVLDSIPLWVSCGTEDRFYDASTLFVQQRTTPPAGGFSPGEHDGDYWMSQVQPALSWIAPILAT